MLIRRKVSRRGAVGQLAARGPMANPAIAPIQGRKRWHESTCAFRRQSKNTPIWRGRAPTECEISCGLTPLVNLAIPFGQIDR